MLPTDDVGTGPEPDRATGSLLLDERQVPVTATLPTDADPIGEAVRCGRCGRAMPATRRFCRCGAPLDRPDAEEAEDEPAREPWRARLGGGLRRGRRFWRQLRAANGGLRARYDQARSAEVYLTRTVAFLAGLGIVVTFTLPTTGAVRAGLRDTLESFDPRGFVVVPVDSATSDPPPDGSAPWFDPAFAVDGTTGRAWAAPWQEPEAAGPPCLRDGGAPALVIALARPTDIERIEIVSGLPDSSPDGAMVFRPSTMDVSWDEGEGCVSETLEDVTEPQVLTLGARDVTTLRLVVVAAHPPQDQAVAPLVAISEVRLLSRAAAG